MDNFIPSYDNYREILRLIKNTKKYMDYREAKNAEQFIILRHDIEFSVDRAYRLSQIETDEGICSTYFVQITNNAYNALSNKNSAMLRKMLENGHHVGLHYHRNGILDEKKMCENIRIEAGILSGLLNSRVDRFSMHRPVEESHYYDLEVEELINAYSKEYFTHFISENQKDDISVKYIADSKHQWNYGIPDKNTLERFSKIQLLIHPYSWGEKGKNAEDTFNDIAEEKEKELLDTFDTETKIFGNIRNNIEKTRGKYYVI